VPVNRIRFVHCKHGGEEVRASVGSEIVGRLSKSEGPHMQLSIYRRDCPGAPTGDQAIPLEWIGNRRPGVPVRVRIEAVDRLGLLEMILQKIYKLYDFGIYLHSITASVNLEQKAEVILTVEAPNYKTVELLSVEIEKLATEGIVNDHHLETLTPLEKMRLRESSRPSNPYTLGPVHDRRVFKGRETEIQQIITNLEGTQNAIVLYGLNRVGKTSLLRYIQAHVAEAYNLVPVMIDLQELPEPSEAFFWLELTNQINAAMENQYHGSKVRSHTFAKRLKDNSFEGFRAWLRERKTALPLRKLLIMIDELNLLDEVWSNRQEARQVAYRLKSIVESDREIKFVFCVQEGLYLQSDNNRNQLVSWPLLRAGYPLRLDYIDREAAKKLIREPMGQMLTFTDAIVKQIIHLTACHPYYLHHMLLLIVNQVCSDQRKIVTSEDLQWAVADIMTKGEHIFQNLQQEYSSEPRESIMQALAVKSGLECLPVTVEELSIQLRRQGSKNIRRQELNDCLGNLSEIGLIQEQRKAAQTHYQIRIPLFNQWLIENQPGRLLEDKTR
jgi:hypothetical protein